jgi:hypothetical protein
VTVQNNYLMILRLDSVFRNVPRRHSLAKIQTNAYINVMEQISTNFRIYVLKNVQMVFTTQPLTYVKIVITNVRYVLGVLQMNVRHVLQDIFYSKVNV